MNITIIGAGYVGMSIAALLSQTNKVIVYDIDKERVELINKKISPIKDELINAFLEQYHNVYATDNKKDAYINADYIIIALPTNFDLAKNCFNCDDLEKEIKDIKQINNKAIIAIKSTVPIGFTKQMYEKYQVKILYSPEFLREGRSLYDNLYPSRIIAGTDVENEEMRNIALEFINILSDNSRKEHGNELLIMKYDEAESVKLFSNAYLATRISFFNELDTFAKAKNLSAQRIIEGVCCDDRIGDHYNNPSFGYGGYCLPKDTKQLLSSFGDIPQNIFSAVINSNRTRKQFIANDILKNIKDNSTIGIYRLTMKKDSDNFREAAIIDIIYYLQDIAPSINIIIYEPSINASKCLGLPVYNNFEEFEKKSNIIIANRCSPELDNLRLLFTNNKVYTRDIFEEN